MAHGFIHNSFQVKLLILYILGQVRQPIDLPTLTDLALSDSSVDYFSFADALEDLISTEHIQLEGELYAITPKGRANCTACESELAFSVRSNCDELITVLNERLRRDNVVKATVRPAREGAGCTVQMVLNDESGNLMTLEMLAPDEGLAEQLRKSFLAHPEQIYNEILETVMKQR